MRRRGFIFILALCISSLVFAQQVSWNVWVKQLRKEAVAKGISARLFDQVFSNIKRPSRKQIKLDRSQPEKRLTYIKYRNSRISNYRIQLGRKKFKKYRHLLTEIGHQYKVNPCTIAAIWGIESSYGHFMGSFPVIQSLSTLAYDGRRSKFFRRELFYALHILNEGHIKNKDFKGEWAGASGQSQFLPSSWYKFAVDHNGDGRKDIWKDQADVFASIANYLKGNGWKNGMPWSIRVRGANRVPKRMVSTKFKQPLSAWYKLGIEPASGQRVPRQNYEASLIRPHGGPDMLVFNDFKVLLRYNNSIYYAGAVAYLSDKICRRPS
jgi:membrane-bound lytic murein transglycosylase B